MKKLTLAIIIIFVCTFAFSADLVKDNSSVNAFDRALMRPYSKGLDVTGDVLSCLSMASAGILAFEDSSEYVTIATMYAETIALTYGTNEVIKHFVDRNRPYTYYSNAPESEKDDWENSFPSRHSALAFAGASFTSYAFCRYNPDSKYIIPVIATCSALAVATSVLRVASGNHFATDVLAGAAIGTVIGLGIPMLHTIGQNQVAEMSVSPFGLVFKLNF